MDFHKKYIIPGNKYFYPLQSRPSSLDVFQELIECDLRNLQENINSDANTSNNLTFGERRALRELSNNPNITVRGADKGGTITVMDSELYRLLNMLNDAKTYKPINGRPNCSFSE